MQRVAATVPTHRARRPGKPLQPVENPGPTLGASPSTCLSTLAPAAALSLPLLAGVPTSYEYYDGDARLFAFLRRLAELGIAGTAPSEIEKLRTSPLAYTEAALASWVNAKGGDIIDGNINYSLAIQAENEGMLANTAMKDSLLITLEAEQCGYMVAGAALDALEAKAKGLGRAFYHVLDTSLAKWMRIYNLSDARYYVDGIKQMAEGDDEAENYEFPDVEGAIPEFLRDAASPGPAHEHNLSLLQKHEKDSKIGGWIRRLFEIHRLAQLPAAGDVRELLGAYYDQACMPSLLIVFDKQDAIEGCFDEEAQQWPEGSSEPCFAAAFVPADDNQTAAAFECLATFLQINRELCQLIKDFATFAKPLERGGQQPSQNNV